IIPLVLEEAQISVSYGLTVDRRQLGVPAASAQPRLPFLKEPARPGEDEDEHAHDRKHREQRFLVFSKGTKRIESHINSSFMANRQRRALCQGLDIRRNHVVWVGGGLHPN